MKEYIDRNEFLKRLNVLYNVLDNLEKMIYSSQLIELVDTPVADVIEREKIDKAIEEITGYARFHRDKTHNDTELGKYLAYEKCIEILKRNIER